MEDIEPCRTARLGGPLYGCPHGQTSHDRDHSCTNRHRPTCPHAPAQPWLERQQRVLVPVPPFLVTCTRPAELRALARRHQQVVYHLLCRSAAAARQALAWDPRCSGGRIGMGGVRHTWTRDRRDHPPVHDLVPGGGLTADGRWLPSRHDCLVHVQPWSGLFRAQCRDHRHKTDLCPCVEAPVWNQDGVGHGAPVGRGEDALRSLAPDILRVASSHHRLLTRPAGHVTVQDKDAATDQVNPWTLPAEACMRRVLQHVRPARCLQVRYDGVLRPTNRPGLHRARARRGADPVDAETPGRHRARIEPTAARARPRGPTCGRTVRRVHTLRPQGRSPPRS
jgi:hypothetical protein